MNIFDYIDLSRICFVSEDNKIGALKKLVEHSRPCLYNSDDFLRETLEREKLLSTGLGFELAFPHSKCDAVVDFFITIGISPNGLEWEAFDGEAVKLIFLIGGVTEEQEKYLKILGALSTLVNNKENRTRLIQAKTPLEFYSIFNEIALSKKLTA